MGQLILCNRNLAKNAYRLENADLNLYSLEELSYYLLQNTYQLEPDFMNGDFCRWVQEELKEEELATELQRDIKENRGIGVFVQRILMHTGYADRDEIQRVLEVIQELEHKSEAEKGKLRADRLMKKQRYTAAITEYKKILEREDLSSNPVLEGNILHNIGTAYVGLFLFDQAAEYYGAAYGKNNNQESLKDELYCLKLSGQDERERQCAMENHLGQEILNVYAKEMKEIINSAWEDEVSEKIRRMERESIEEAYEEAARKQIEKWKTDYERYSGL